MMMKTKVLAGPILCSVLAATAMVGSFAMAQPDLNNAPKGENPKAQQRPNRGNRGNGAQMMEQRMREMLEHVGIKEAPTQDAVLDFMKSDMEARRPMREKSGKLYQALRDGGVNDDQLLALVTDFRAAQEAEKARREQALKDLDGKVHYNQNPRLEAVLLLSGVIGDGGPMPMNFGGRGNGANRGPGAQGPKGGQNDAKREEHRKKMMEQFDANKDGKLDDAEQQAMKDAMQKRREERGKKKDDAPPPPPPPPADDN